MESEVKILTEQNQKLQQQLAVIESRTHVLDDRNLEKRLLASKFFQEMVTQAMQDALAEKARK
ncbi:MAG: hypothetical protein ACHQ03_04645 [Candidatus Bathyarchaeia archaeon]